MAQVRWGAGHQMKKPSAELQKMLDRLEDMAAIFSEDTADLLDKARMYIGDAMEDLESSGL
jgi:hypothetical protein